MPSEHIDASIKLIKLKQPDDIDEAANYHVSNTRGSMEIYTSGNSWKRPNQYHSSYQRNSDRETKSKKQMAKKSQSYRQKGI